MPTNTYTTPPAKATPHRRESQKRRSDRVQAHARPWWELPPVAFAAFIVYVSALAVSVAHHEPWADEAQNWLVSRDSSWWQLISERMHYESVPPLWHSIEWIAAHWFHAPYGAISWIGAAFAVVGCFIFLRYAPFPLPLKVAFPFTFYMLFQYAVVTRVYILFPLAAFLAAHAYRTQRSRPILVAAALGLLALVCSQALMLSIGLAVSYSWESFQERAEGTRSKNNYLLATLLFIAVLGFIALVDWPASDRGFALQNNALPPVADVLTRALSDGIAYWAPGSAILLASIAWFTVVRRQLSVILCPMLLLAVFSIRVYLAHWHCGAVILAVVIATWIAWPEVDENLDRTSRISLYMATGALACIFAVQMVWSWQTVRFDFQESYCGAADAAAFLRAQHADSEYIYGMGFKTIAILPYFDHNVFGNFVVPDGTSFWRWDRQHTVAAEDPRAVLERKAEWIVYTPVMYSDFEAYYPAVDRKLQALGYKLVHISKGEMMFGMHPIEPNTYYIYQRI
jgi:hypothetical protein